MSSQFVYLSHGGGPLPILGEPSHAELVAVLKNLATLLPPPEVIIVVSAHWEMPQATVTASAAPPLLYDYAGFPPAAYQIRYLVPGAPTVAQNLCNHLQQHGMAAQLEAQRGLDHGVFIPLKLMYPAAAIPCLQLSLLDSLDAAQHIQLGRALAEFNSAQLLIVGSGFSFHNFRAFFSPSTAEVERQNLAFEAWLVETCSNPQLSEAQRTERLVDWLSAPAARFCHPRAEHLLPLHVCYGAAQAPARQVFRYQVMGKWASAYLW